MQWSAVFLFIPPTAPTTVHAPGRSTATTAHAPRRVARCKTLVVASVRHASSQASPTGGSYSTRKHCASPNRGCPLPERKRNVQGATRCAAGLVRCTPGGRGELSPQSHEGRSGGPLHMSQTDAISPQCDVETKLDAAGDGGTNDTGSGNGHRRRDDGDGGGDGGGARRVLSGWGVMQMCRTFWSLLRALVSNGSGAAGDALSDLWWSIALWSLLVLVIVSLLSVPISLSVAVWLWCRRAV